MASARGHKVGAFIPMFSIRVGMNCEASDEADELVDLGVCVLGCCGGVDTDCLSIAL